MDKKIVLCFGTYEIFHKGHKFFLKKAKEKGDLLYIVVALDETVERVKGKKPRKSQEERKSILESQDFIDKVFLGNPLDKYKIIEEIKPNLICLGYDQIAFTEKLEEELTKRSLKTEILRINESFKPEIFKSSKL